MYLWPINFLENLFTKLNLIKLPAKNTSFNLQQHLKAEIFSKLRSCAFFATTCYSQAQGGQSLHGLPKMSNSLIGQNFNFPRKIRSIKFCCKKKPESRTSIIAQSVGARSNTSRWKILFSNIVLAKKKRKIFCNAKKIKNLSFFFWLTSFGFRHLNNCASTFRDQKSPRHCCSGAFLGEKIPSHLTRGARKTLRAFFSREPGTRPLG